MKVLIITGSPHAHGTSNTLVNEFVRGAKESGNVVTIYDATKGNIHPCLGCDSCGRTGLCIQKDDGNDLLAKIIDSDVLVLATPIYYFGMTAQLKTVIDRFYARNGEISFKHLKAIAIATAWNDDSVVMSGLEKYLDILFDYLHFQKVAYLFAKGAGSVDMMPKKYMTQAYELGKNLE